MKTTAKNSRKSANGKAARARKGEVDTQWTPTDVYESFTQLILDKLEQGVVPWYQPWNCNGLPSNYLTKKPYRGINLWLLLSLNHELPFYLTFKQAKELGGMVKKGSKAIPVCYWNFVYKHKETGRTIPDGLLGDYPIDTLTKVCFLKEYKVFPIEQIDGIDWELSEKGENQSLPVLERCESVFAEMHEPPKLTHEREEAYYHPSLDLINLPPKPRFKTAEDYYSVLFHELVHSTGHKNRLNRPGVEEIDYFGSENYSTEELIAEMGAGFLCGFTGIQEARLIDNQAAYIKNWISRLKNDKNLLIDAASKAQKAVDYLLNVCPF
ncbi:ArdC family protein [Algoriphagus confluentis]|uniref:Zincin-like metallopeptidase domain-containing protein n=1 Tax=Algoriphagus confluentis TaxID=1697556 RepID=A0ABQ6PRT4_9BACT|nr:zincin-like metallopeptidase domain-containing protein [Algoriphagus confluentis]